MRMILILAAAVVMATPMVAQTTNDPFPSPIASSEDIISVSFTVREDLAYRPARLEQRQWRVRYPRQ